MAHAEAGDCPLGKHVLPPARGAGDTVARAAHAMGVDKLAKAWERVTGRPCGCKVRQERLNRMMPYKQDGREQQ